MMANHQKWVLHQTKEEHAILSSLILPFRSVFAQGSLGGWGGMNLEVAMKKSFGQDLKYLQTLSIYTSLLIWDSCIYTIRMSASDLQLQQNLHKPIKLTCIFLFLSGKCRLLKCGYQPHTLCEQHFYSYPVLCNFHMHHACVIVICIQLFLKRL